MAEPLIASFIHDLERLAVLFDGKVTDAIYAEVVGHGEVWSARLMSAVLCKFSNYPLPGWMREFPRAERAAQSGG